MNVRVPGVRVVNVGISDVDFVHAETGIEICERNYGWANPAWSLSGRGVLDRCVVCIVNHQLVFVGVSEEYVGYDVRRVAIHDLVKEIAWIIQGIGAIPAGQDMVDDPYAFTSIFSLLELLNKECELTGYVGICGIDIVVEIIPIPKITVHGNDPYAILIKNRVGCIVKFRLLGSSIINPTVHFPQICHMIVVPAELLSKGTREAMG